MASVATPDTGESRLHYLVRVAAEFARRNGETTILYDDARCDGYCLSDELIHEALPQIERLEKPPAPVALPEMYTHWRRGGVFAKLGRAAGQGVRVHSTDFVVYKDVVTGEMHVRLASDFRARMRRVP